MFFLSHIHIFHSSNKQNLFFMVAILLFTALILRNIAPLSTADGIFAMLASYASLSAGNIRLIKDKQTGQNRGFAFVQFSSPLVWYLVWYCCIQYVSFGGYTLDNLMSSFLVQEASQLLTILQSLQPPLKLDGKTIGVDYAKSARK